METDWMQTLTVLAIVATAAGYIARRWWRALAATRRDSRPGCGSDCGCSHD